MRQLKTILSGQGYRITNRQPGHWHKTIIVRGPNSRRNNFVYSLVATEGITGRPQMTFDSNAAAQAWLDAHRGEFDDVLYVGPTRQTYSCYKTPLADGSECYLDRSNFPAEGDVEAWSTYESEWPSYFATGPRFGRFSESVSPAGYWLQYKFGITEEELYELCFQNTDSMKVGLPFNYDGEDIMINNIFLTPDGSEEFQSLDVAMYAYGSDFIENFISELLEEERRNGREPSDKKYFGKFKESVTLIESYNVEDDTFKRLVIKYVTDNSYIRGVWNGRYCTPSPTVDNLNAILRGSSIEDSQLCSEEELARVNSWVDNLQPAGPAMEWMNRAIASWHKTNHFEKDDLKNVVPLVSYYNSQIMFERHQEWKRERERRHQEYIASEANSWAGEVGQQVSFTVESYKMSYSEYGGICNAEGTDGRHYSFGCYNNEETKLARGCQVTGKIKKLEEFRGIKQTRLWKVEISENSNPRFGSFSE